MSPHLASPTDALTSDMFGYRILNQNSDFAIEWAWDKARHATKMQIVDCANPHSLVEAEANKEFQAALQRADLLLPDGAGIVLAARLLRRAMTERIAGYEFFTGLSQRTHEGGELRYFFLGSSPCVLERIAARLARDYPHVKLVGTYSPPFVEHFTEAENEAMIAAVNRSKPDVLWVGMTAPKQELWLEAHRNRLDVRLGCAVGAVFDFYAGTRARAPQYLCRLGLEWLPRLLREPRRLWRRNFISTPLFLRLIVQEWLRDHRRADDIPDGIDFNEHFDHAD